MYYEMTYLRPKDKSARMHCQLTQMSLQCIFAIYVQKFKSSQRVQTFAMGPDPK